MSMVPFPGGEIAGPASNVKGSFQTAKGPAQAGAGAPGDPLSDFSTAMDAFSRPSNASDTKKLSVGEEPGTDTIAGLGPLGISTDHNPLLQSLLEALEVAVPDIGQLQQNADVAGSSAEFSLDDIAALAARLRTAQSTGQWSPQLAEIASQLELDLQSGNSRLSLNEVRAALQQALANGRGAQPSGFTPSAAAQAEPAAIVSAVGTETAHATSIAPVNAKQSESSRLHRLTNLASGLAKSGASGGENGRAAEAPASLFSPNGATGTGSTASTLASAHAAGAAAGTGNGGTAASAGAGTGQAVNVPTEPSSTVRQISEQIGIRLAQNAVTKNSEFTIRLNPEQLGTVTVKLTLASDGALKADFSTRNAQTGEILKQDAGNLESGLRRLGFKLQSQDIQVQVRLPGGGTQPNIGGRPDASGIPLNAGNAQTPGAQPVLNLQNVQTSLRGMPSGSQVADRGPEGLPQAQTAGSSQNGSSLNNLQNPSSQSQAGSNAHGQGNGAAGQNMGQQSGQQQTSGQATQGQFGQQLGNGQHGAHQQSGQNAFNAWTDQGQGQRSPVSIPTELLQADAGSAAPDQSDGTYDLSSGPAWQFGWSDLPVHQSYGMRVAFNWGTKIPAQLNLKI